MVLAHLMHISNDDVLTSILAANLICLTRGLRAILAQQRVVGVKVPRNPSRLVHYLFIHFGAAPAADTMAGLPETGAAGKWKVGDRYTGYLVTDDLNSLALSRPRLPNQTCSRPRLLAQSNRNQLRTNPRLKTRSRTQIHVRIQMLSEVGKRWQVLFGRRTQLPRACCTSLLLHRPLTVLQSTVRKKHGQGQQSHTLHSGGHREHPRG